MSEQSMQGKTVVITGATNGLGESIAQSIARAGAQTVIISRSEEKCRATADRLQHETGNPNVRYYVADLSAQAQVRDVAAKLRADLTRLDVLINNAGAWFTEYKESVDGIEMTWALNHLNYYLLTEELDPLLRATAEQTGDVRIINQASSAHHEGQMHWDNLPFKDGAFAANGRGSYGPGWAVYSQSKLANVLHAFALARRYDSTGITANAVHPGVVVTGFSQNNGWIYQLAAPIRKLFNRTPVSDGAAPAVWLATAPEAATITGAYYGPPHEREDVNPIANDLAQQERLMQVSAEMTGRVVPA